MVFNDLLEGLEVRETKLKEWIALRQAELDDINSTIDVLCEYRCPDCVGSGELNLVDEAGSRYQEKCGKCKGKGVIF